MKLVTGIEAIQSGKPFRYHHPKDGPTAWMKIGDLKGDRNWAFSPDEVVSESWEIKQEQRDFWVNISELKNWDTSPRQGHGWIKVREVLDE